MGGELGYEYGKEGRHHEGALSNGLELGIMWAQYVPVRRSQLSFRKEPLLHTTQIQAKDPNFSGMQ